MGRVITTKDGKNHIILQKKDIRKIIDAYCGSEVLDVMDEFYQDDMELVEEAEELEKMIDGWKGHHMEVMEQLNEDQKGLADLICQPELDRKAISTICGKLSYTIHKELR